MSDDLVKQTLHSLEGLDAYVRALDEYNDALVAANEEMKAKLEKAVEALEPYADLAKHHAADAPEWGPFDSVSAQVSIRNLRDARATLEELKGEADE